MNILFICTHNRCRSILSEAICRQLGGERLSALSAGSQPVGEVHPLSLKYLAAKGYDTANLQSQSWHDFENIKPEIVITVCDSAASEACPLWFGEGVQEHWGLSDPSKLVGSEAEIEQAFYAVMNIIERRVQALLAVDFEQMDKEQLQQQLKRIAAEVN